MTSDRRKAPRVAVKRLAALFHPQADPHDVLHAHPSHKAALADLSAQGLKVLVREAVPEGTMLSLALEIPSLRLEVQVKGKVTRCRYIERKVRGETVPGHELGISLEHAGVDYEKLVERLRVDPLLRAGGI